MSLRLVASADRPEIVVDRASVLVGRHRRCDYQLISPRVSRWHCSLTEVDGEVCVRDLGSTNGIWINGQRVQSGRVRPGDVLAIAHIRFRLAEAPLDRPSTADFPDRPNEAGTSPADPHDTALHDIHDGS